MNNLYLLANTLIAKGSGTKGSGSGSASGARSKALEGLTSISGAAGSDTDLMSLVTNILNAVFLVIGVIAVVVIIIGGVNYTTSQGDPSKVKKAKDTILYGIIGLIVSLLAYAIVNFVLTNIAGSGN